MSMGSTAIQNQPNTAGSLPVTKRRTQNTATRVGPGAEPAPGAGSDAVPAGQASGDGGLVGHVNALAVLDRRADPRPCGLIEAILEGKPPFGVASLLNHAVHRAWPRSCSWLEGEAGASRPPRRWRGSPPYSSPVLPGSWSHQRLTGRGLTLTLGQPSILMAGASSQTTGTAP